MADCEASQCVEETIPKLPRSVGRVVKLGGLVKVISTTLPLRGRVDRGRVTLWARVIAGQSRVRGPPRDAKSTSPRRWNPVHSASVGGVVPVEWRRARRSRAGSRRSLPGHEVDGTTCVRVAFRGIVDPRR